MHSSRMGSARLLPVSPSMRCSEEGVPAWGVYLLRGCTCWGMYLPGGCVYLPEGGYLPGYLPGTPTPVNRILNTRYLKYYLAPTSLRAVKITQKCQLSVYRINIYYNRPSVNLGLEGTVRYIIT